MAKVDFEKKTVAVTFDPDKGRARHADQSDIGRGAIRPLFTIKIVYE